jgi:AcrR family transcriptional regulator
MTQTIVSDPPGCARRGRPRDERIDADIVVAAVDVLMDAGFDRFSVEAVAARAAVAKTTVYRRFPTRGDLITAALEHLGEETAPVVGGSVRDQVLAIVSAVRDSTPDSPRWRILMHAFGSDDPELVEQVYTRVLSSRSELLRSTIARGVANGELRDDLDADAAVAVLVGPMLYLGMWRSRGSVRRVGVDEVVDLVMKGLTPATGS